MLPCLVNCIQSQDPHVRAENLHLNLSFDLRSHMHMCACTHAHTHAHKETQLRQLVFKADKGPQWAFSRRIYETANMMFNTVNYQRSANENHNGQFSLSRMTKIKIKAGNHKMGSERGKFVPQFVNECKVVSLLWKTIRQLLRLFHTELPYDLK